MAENTAQQRMAYLYEEIARLNRAYYDLDAPLVTDAEYDAMIAKIKENL